MTWIAGALGFAFGALLVGVLLLVRLGRLRAETADARARASSLGTQLDVALTDRDESREAAVTERAARAEVDRSLAASEERVRALEDAEKRLTDTFRVAGAEALEKNANQFMQQARLTLEKVLADAKGDVVKRQEAIDHLIRPIRESLERQDRAVREIEKERQKAYAGLEAQIGAMMQSNQRLDTQTNRLVNALSRPTQRGRWGEVQLRNAVELAGMTEHCDFYEQRTEGDKRPDLTVRLPGGGLIAVDAKAPLEAYLDAHDAQDAARPPLLEQHAAAVERHFKGLARKEYWKQFPRAPKIVVMFMPLESALVAALEKKPHLHEEAMRNNVLIATPMLLVALLRAVAYGWQQESVAENARAIADAGSELYERLSRFVERLATVGDRLGQASRSYNEAVGSLESRLLPSARRLHELKATRRDAIESPTPIDVEPRSITQTELIGLETADADTDADTDVAADAEPPAITKLRPTPDRSCAAP